MKTIVKLLGLTTVLLSTTTAPQAQQCPGTATNAFLQYGSMAGGGTMTLAFVNTGRNCTGMPDGAATDCDQASGMGLFIRFRATWPSTTARLADATGGCDFTCPGGQCRVGQNGLPVELLDFYIDESADPQSEGSTERAGSTSDDNTASKP